MLKDRVALVTGASLGVGKGIAIALGVPEARATMGRFLLRSRA